MVVNFSHVLERLGLAPYFQAFVDEGFDSWETLQDITESDLQALGVKLGHRRKLQRAIIDSRGQTKDNIPLGLQPRSDLNEDPQRSEEESIPNTKGRKRTCGASVTVNPAGQKRRYRRHPKPDEFAPERPPSAYVIFSNQMRDKLKGQELSFIEIAKIVGESWQDLSAQEKEPCERQALAWKEKYYADLNEYKKMPQYAQYQQYLVDFKAKDNSNNKKIKSETDSTRHNTRDYGDKHVETHSHNSQLPIVRSPSDHGGTRDGTKSGWYESTSPASLAKYPMASPQSARNSPPASSPKLAGFRPSSSGVHSDDGSWGGASSKRHLMPLHLLSGPTYSTSNAASNGNPSNSPISPSIEDQASTTMDIPTFSPHRIANNALPPLMPTLTREGTTKSSVSDGSRNPSPWGSVSYSLPPIEDSKTPANRILPVPVPTLGAVNGIPSRSTIIPSTPPMFSRPIFNGGALTLDDRTKASFATLLRAGETLDRASEQPKNLMTTRETLRTWGRGGAT